MGRVVILTLAAGSHLFSFRPVSGAADSPSVVQAKPMAYPVLPTFSQASDAGWQNLRLQKFATVRRGSTLPSHKPWAVPLVLFSALGLLARPSRAQPLHARRLAGTPCMQVGRVRRARAGQQADVDAHAVEVPLSEGAGASSAAELHAVDVGGAVGSSLPPLVVLHGLLGSGSNFDSWARALA